jgi:hypothetical protein
MYAQGRTADAQRCLDLYSLPAELLDDLMVLPQGICFLKRDINAPILMQHLRSDWEVGITDTDAAMGGAASAGRRQ